MRYDDLKEAPLALRGDWDEGDAKIADQSLIVHRKYWKKVGSLRAVQTVYDITQNIADPRHYLVGREDVARERFLTIAMLDLETVLGSNFGYRSLLSVESVVVRQNMRGYQIATQLYRFVVHSGIVLLSDMSQYFGARRLWSRLSRQTDLVVDVVDTNKNSVVARGVTLHHGILDADFDQTYWSYDIAHGKHTIRFALRDITTASASPIALA